MLRIDWDFIDREEGKEVLKGYVPRDDGGNESGVTIATGVDLGQRDRAEIIGLFIPDALKRRLVKYALLRGDVARRRLLTEPLTITKEEAKALDDAIARQMLCRLITVFERESGKRFECQPPEAQTVLFSLAWNFGPNLHKSGIKEAWPLIVSGDWKGLALFLKKFSPKSILRKRRLREAAHLALIGDLDG